MNNVYAIKFNGHYPVGAVAVVAARSEMVAKDLLMAELKVQGLLDKNKKSELKVSKIDTSRQNVQVILNGDY